MQLPSVMRFVWAYITKDFQCILSPLVSTFGSDTIWTSIAHKELRLRQMEYRLSLQSEPYFCVLKLLPCYFCTVTQTNQWYCAVKWSIMYMYKRIVEISHENKLHCGVRTDVAMRVFLGGFPVEILPRPLLVWLCPLQPHNGAPNLIFPSRLRARSHHFLIIHSVMPARRQVLRVSFRAVQWVPSFLRVILSPGQAELHCPWWTSVSLIWARFLHSFSIGETSLTPLIYWLFVMLELVHGIGVVG